MDDKFSDRMQELADLPIEVLQQRWDTVVQVANTANDETKVRLVLIACGAKIDRDADEWFWRPFWEHEQNFKIEHGAALHTALAHAAARYLVNMESCNRTAIALRLACNAEWTPKHQDLIDEAIECLSERDVPVPALTKVNGFWSATTRDALAANPADPDNLKALHTGAQSAITALAQNVTALTGWARAADVRYRTDQRLIEWLLNGVRADGTAWSALPPGVAAVDAAREIAALLTTSPQPRHEAMLLQVLAVAGHDETPIKGSVKVPTGGEAPPDALLTVTPILAAVAANKSLPKKTPSELAVRTLWEAWAAAIWTGE